MTGFTSVNTVIDSAKEVLNGFCRCKAGLRFVTDSVYIDCDRTKCSYSLTHLIFGFVNVLAYIHIISRPQHRQLREIFNSQFYCLTAQVISLSHSTGNLTSSQHRQFYGLPSPKSHPRSRSHETGSFPFL